MLQALQLVMMERFPSVCLVEENKRLVTFRLPVSVNAGGLEPIGQNLYEETAGSGAPVLLQPGIDAAGQLMQGALGGF